jgi:hypothetical protein
LAIDFASSIKEGTIDASYAPLELGLWLFLPAGKSYSRLADDETISLRKVALASNFFRAKIPFRK